MNENYETFHNLHAPQSEISRSTSSARFSTHSHFRMSCAVSASLARMTAWCVLWIHSAREVDADNSHRKGTHEGERAQ
jgi:hypothetical protein